jgi:RNA polymerase sigma-70 factor (ECF subfamily)
MTFRPPDDPDSDELLLSRTAAGDAEAFARLFQRRQGQVFRFALHMTGSITIAEDVTQEAFLRVMRDAGRFEAGRSAVVSWLCGIARNCALQRLERERPYQAWNEDDEPGAGEGTATADPVAALVRAEGIEQVRQAVLSLPIRYREVVALCDLQELSYAETADALGCAVGTVRSRLHRARALLASKLSHVSQESAGRIAGARSCA